MSDCNVSPSLGLFEQWPVLISDDARVARLAVDRHSRQQMEPLLNTMDISPPAPKVYRHLMRHRSERHCLFLFLIIACIGLREIIEPRLFSIERHKGAARPDTTTFGQYQLRRAIDG